MVMLKGKVLDLFVNHHSKGHSSQSVGMSLSIFLLTCGFLL